MPLKSPLQARRCPATVIPAIRRLTPAGKPDRLPLSRSTVSEERGGSRHPARLDKMAGGPRQDIEGGERRRKGLSLCLRIDLSEDVLGEGLSAQEILDNGLTAGMDYVGVECEAGDVSVPEVLRAAKTVQPSVRPSRTAAHRLGRDAQVILKRRPSQ